MHFNGVFLLLLLLYLTFLLIQSCTFRTTPKKMSLENCDKKCITAWHPLASQAASCFFTSWESELVPSYASHFCSDSSLEAMNVFFSNGRRLSLSSTINGRVINSSQAIRNSHHRLRDVFWDAFGKNPHHGRMSSL